MGSRRKKELPEDLIVEILLRLPATTLHRFKYVSKFWYDLISSPSFLRIYGSNNSTNKNVTLYIESFDCNTERTKINFWIYPNFPMKLTIAKRVGKARIVGCSNGVVCLSFLSEKLLVIWNPATKESRLINGPVIDNRSYTLNYTFTGFCVHENTFKITQLSCFPGGAELYVFTQITNLWCKKVVIIPGHINERYLVVRFACVGRHMYWITGAYQGYANTNRIGSNAIQISCFDMVDEMFQDIELPFPDSNRQCLRLRCYNELAMFAVKETASPRTDFDIWVMNHTDWSWSKKFTCRPAVSVTRPIGFFYKDELHWVVFESSYLGFVLCDPETGMIEEIFCNALEFDSTFIFYKESLAPVY